MSFVPTGLITAAQSAEAVDVPTLVHAVWLIPAFPLLALVILIAFGRKLGEPWAGWVAVGGMAAAFVASACTFVGLLDLPAEHRSHVQQAFTWLSVANFTVDLSFLAAALRNNLPSYGYDEKDISEHIDAALKDHFMLSDKRACDMALERYGPNGTVLEGAVEKE